MDVEVLLGSARSIWWETSLNELLLALAKEICRVGDWSALASCRRPCQKVSSGMDLTVRQNEHYRNAEHDGNQAFEEEKILPSAQVMGP